MHTLQELAKTPIKGLKIKMVMSAIPTPRTGIGVESMMIVILHQKQCAVVVEAEIQVINGGYYSMDC